MGPGNRSSKGREEERKKKEQSKKIWRKCI
jgi:hypothetical protein